MKKLKNIDFDQKILLSTIAIATILIAVFAATYAYFTAAGDVSGRSDVTVITSSRDQTITTSVDVLLEVKMSDMQQSAGSNSYTASKQSDIPAELIIQTTLGSETGSSTCTYDVVYIPAVGGAYNKSIANPGNLKEFTILLNAVENDAVHVGEYDGEYDLTGVNSIVTIAEDQTITVTEPGVVGHVTWQITPRYYNLAIDQSDNANKMFGGKVEINNIRCVSTRRMMMSMGTPIRDRILADNGGVQYIIGKGSPEFDYYGGEPVTTNEGMFAMADNYGISY